MLTSNSKEKTQPGVEVANSSASKGRVTHIIEDSVTRHGAVVNYRTHVSVQQKQVSPNSADHCQGGPGLQDFKRRQKSRFVCGFS